MSEGPLDHQTLEAIDVLARAVDQARVPGVLEFRLLANALRRAIDSRGSRELQEAARVYQTLDRDFRARIIERAQAEARACVEQGNSAKTATPEAGATVRAGSGFLAALNGGRAPAPPAQSRTKTELLPGEPLPRSS